MRGRVQYDLLTATDVDAETVRVWVVEQLADQQIYEDANDPNIPPTVHQDYGGTWHVLGSSRFVVAGSEQSVATRITSVWNRGSNPYKLMLAGSKVATHDCTHDEDPPQPCSITWSVK